MVSTTGGVTTHPGTLSTRLARPPRCRVAGPHDRAQHRHARRPAAAHCRDPLRRVDPAQRQPRHRAASAAAPRAERRPVARLGGGRDRSATGSHSPRWTARAPRRRCGRTGRSARCAAIRAGTGRGRPGARRRRRADPARPRSACPPAPSPRSSSARARRSAYAQIPLPQDDPRGAAVDRGPRPPRPAAGGQPPIGEHDEPGRGHHAGQPLVGGGRQRVKAPRDPAGLEGQPPGRRPRAASRRPSAPDRRPGSPRWRSAPRRSPAPSPARRRTRCRCPRPAPPARPRSAGSAGCDAGCRCPARSRSATRPASPPRSPRRPAGGPAPGRRWCTAAPGTRPPTSVSAARSSSTPSGSRVRSSPITSSFTRSVSNASRASRAVLTASAAV